MLKQSTFSAVLGMRSRASCGGFSVLFLFCFFRLQTIGVWISLLFYLWAFGGVRRFLFSFPCGLFRGVR